MGKNKNPKKNKQGPGAVGQQEKPALVKENLIEENTDEADFASGSTTASKSAPVKENPVEEKVDEDDFAGGSTTASEFAVAEKMPVEDKVDEVDFADGGLTAEEETQVPSFGEWGNVSPRTPVTDTPVEKASNATSFLVWGEPSKLSSANEEGDSTGVSEDKFNPAPVNKNKSTPEGSVEQSDSVKTQDSPVAKAGDDQGSGDWGFAQLGKKKRGKKEEAAIQEVKIKEEATRPASAWNSDGTEQKTPVALSLPLASEEPSTSTLADSSFEPAASEPEPPAEPEPAPSPEPVKEDDVWGTVLMKKKKGRKGKDEAKVEKPPPPPAELTVPTELALPATNALPTDDPIPTKKAPTIDEAPPINEALPTDEASPIDEATIINVEFPINSVPSTKSVTLDAAATLPIALITALSDTPKESETAEPTEIPTATAQSTVPATSTEDAVSDSTATSKELANCVLPVASKEPAKSITATISDVLTLPTASMTSSVLVSSGSAATSTHAEMTTIPGMSKNSESSIITTVLVPVTSSTPTTSSFPATNASSGTSKKPTAPALATASPVAASLIKAEPSSKLAPAGKLASSDKLVPSGKPTAPSQAWTPSKMASTAVLAAASPTSVWPVKAKKPIASTMSALSPQTEAIIKPPTSKLSEAPSKSKEVATTGVKPMKHDRSDSKPKQMEKTNPKTKLHEFPGTTPMVGQTVGMKLGNPRDTSPKKNGVDVPTDENVVVTKSNPDKTDLKPTEQQASSAAPKAELKPANADNTHTKSTHKKVASTPIIPQAPTDDPIGDANVGLNSITPDNSSRTPTEGGVAAVIATLETDLSDLALLGSTATQSRKMPGEDMSWEDFRDHLVEQLVLISKLPASAREALLESNADFQVNLDDLLKKEKAATHKAQQVKEAAAREAEKKAKLASRPIVNHIK
jgi:hypothetical protein